MYQNRSRITNVIWATLVLAAGFALWHILPDSIRDAVEPIAFAATFTVNTADDHNDGVCNAADCTLREAINAANAGDTISFNIPGSGVHTINATSGYSITKAVTIDGGTQPGFAGVPLIELNGAGAGAGVNGFAVNAPNVIIRGFIVNRFPGYAISFDSLGNDTVQSCYIGTNATGTAASANVAGGIRINAPNITIGGNTSGAGNLISGNKGNGIDVFVGNATIQGNFIGSNSAGATKVSNASGVVIRGAANNIIGGTTIGARNLISGNAEAGVRILDAGATNNLVQGNFIGTDATGTVKYACGAIGCANIIGNSNGIAVLTGAQSTTIGGPATGARNVITGNLGSGVSVSGGGVTSIVGNFIGLDADGISTHGNHVNGVRISAGSVTVGGTEPGTRNVISGNGVILPDRPRPEQQFAVGSGILISGGSGSQILGNFIGTNADGTAAVALYGDEGQTGVSIIGSASNIIGGTTAAARNIISGNDSGVLISGANATNNVVQGNFIGTDVNGVGAVGNDSNGVEISGGANNNIVGGTLMGAGNTIAFNGCTDRYCTPAGVYVQSGTGNAILGNSIFSNNGLGIDLDPLNVVNPNDSCDSDVGANNRQNFPIITSAKTDSTTTTIQGTLNSTANTQLRIEFFANASCDPASNGEGQTFLGFTNAMTDASCNASFSFSAPNAAVAGPVITATATDSNGNTSEFSACVTPAGTVSTIQLSPASYTVAEGDKHVDITIARSGNTSTAASVSFASIDAAGKQNCDVMNGVASSRCDYEGRFATVKFAPGETAKTIPIFIIDDSYAEGQESFTVKLSNAVGSTIGAPAEATVTIIDNDLGNGPNPINDAAFFVRMQYLDFLNREPDAAGSEFWTNQILACGSDHTCLEQRRVSVSSAFFLSIEFQQIGYFVERAYTVLGSSSHYFQTPSGEVGVSTPVERMNEFLVDLNQVGAGVVVGQEGWEAVLENNKRAYMLDFVQRPRFSNLYPTTMTPQEFEKWLFVYALPGIVPSTIGGDAVMAEFGGAKDTSDIAARARALRDVADNPLLVQREFNRALLLMQYFGYLRRHPDDYPDSNYAGYYFWQQKLFQFNGDFQKSEMVKAFISSTEYRQRFGP